MYEQVRTTSRSAVESALVNSKYLLRTPVRIPRDSGSITVLHVYMFALVRVLLDYQF